MRGLWWTIGINLALVVLFALLAHWQAERLPAFRADHASRLALVPYTPPAIRRPAPPPMAPPLTLPPEYRVVDPAPKPWVETADGAIHLLNV